MTYRHLARLAASHPLVLGSASPRRFDLLTELGVPFTRHSSDLEESRLPGESPFEYATRLAVDKALAVAETVNSASVVMGCDTIVVLGEQILEKPVDRQAAFDCLSLLAGKQHVVCSAIALVKQTAVLASGYETTKVFFNPVAPEQIENYIDSGEPMDKAGAYGIQGMGAFLVDRIEGNLDTVIGLPRNLLDTLARDAASILKDS